MGSEVLRGAAARDVLPLDFGEQAIAAARLRVEPRDIRLRLVPVHARHRVVARLLEARIAKCRSRVVLPVAALTTIREAVSTHGAIGCAHEGFVLIERDFVAAHQRTAREG